MSAPPITGHAVQCLRRRRFERALRLAPDARIRRDALTFGDVRPDEFEGRALHTPAGQSGPSALGLHQLLVERRPRRPFPTASRRWCSDRGLGFLRSQSHTTGAFFLLDELDDL